MIGVTLVYGALVGPDPWRQGPPASPAPWPGGVRRSFGRGHVVALGKLRRHGDSVARFVVRLTDGAEVLVIGPEQPAEDRDWLGDLGAVVPLAMTSRDAPWTLAWLELRRRGPVDAGVFCREVFGGNPPHAPRVYGWVVRLGGPPTDAERAWLRSHGYRFSGGAWKRRDRRSTPP